MGYLVSSLLTWWKVEKRFTWTLILLRKFPFIILTRFCVPFLKSVADPQIPHFCPFLPSVFFFLPLACLHVRSELRSEPWQARNVNSLLPCVSTFQISQGVVDMKILTQYTWLEYKSVFLKSWYYLWNTFKLQCSWNNPTLMSLFISFCCFFFFVLKKL